MKKKKIISLIEYGLLSILVCFIFPIFPLNKKLIFLDYVSPTYFNLSKLIQTLNSGWKNPLFEFLKFLIFKINMGFVWEKLIILVLFLISFYYIKKLTKKRYLFALIYFFNPFVYSRIMVGQLSILISYLLIPVYLYYLFNFFNENFNKKDLIKTIFAFTIASSFSPQFFIINIVFFVLLSFFHYLSNRTNQTSPKKYIKPILVFLFFVLLLNTYWLHTIISNPIFNKINEKHIDFFAPKLSQNIPAVAKIMGIWGFWRESGYKTTYSIIPIWLWYFILAVFVVLMLLGYFQTNKYPISKFFYSLWWIGVIFAVGASHPYTKPLFNFFFNTIPFFSGFRDSHKFASLIALSYAYLCPIGIEVISKKIRKKFSNTNIRSLVHFTIYLSFIVLIIFYTFPLINLSGQIKPVIYPLSYEKSNNFLLSENIKGYIIYLPWEGYLTYNWTLNSTPDGRITVPINELIKIEILRSKGAWGTSDFLINNIENCLDNTNETCLENLGIQYILKDKCAEYPLSYTWINETKVFEEGCLEIYKINNKTKISKKITASLRSIIGFIISFLTGITLLFVVLQKRIK